MTALSARQSVKVKAALSLIAVHGHNPRTVQKQAQASIASGTPAHIAYKNALDAFATSVPALRSTLEIAVDLIHHSDDATVSTYDRALTAYNTTGDASHLDNLAPMILEDAKALAIQTGQVSEADAAGWDIGDALGYNEDAFSDTPDVPDAMTAAPGQVVNSQFGFAGAKPHPQGNPSQDAAGSQQSAPGWGPTGYSPVLAQEARQGPQANQSMTGYDPFKVHQDQTGIRVGLSGDAARAWHGTPTGSAQTIQTATGIRIAPTGEQARREAGLPMGPE